MESFKGDEYANDKQEKRNDPQIFVKKVLDHSFNKNDYHLIGSGNFGEVFDYFDKKDDGLRVGVNFDGGNLYVEFDLTLRSVQKKTYTIEYSTYTMNIQC